MESQPLQPHQQRVLDKITNPAQPGLLLSHSMGSGKTRTSIEAIKRLGLPANVVVPASLKGNYLKELKKWTGTIPPNVNIQSQQLLARKGFSDNPNSLLVVDEGQKARSIDSKLLAALKNSKAKKRLILSGTPVINKPSDISPLVNLAAGKHILPESESGFKERYINTQKTPRTLKQILLGVKPGDVSNLKNVHELKKILARYVDYHKNNVEGFPSVNHEVVKVPMGPNQTQIYKTLLHQAPFWMRYKVKWGLPPSKSELDAFRAFLTGARQISNTNYEFIKNKNKTESPKINEAFKFFQSQLANDPRYKAIVYSNYLNSGLNLYKQLLGKSDIPYGEFTGEMPDALRDEMVKKYNQNKLKALLISSAGSEGLDTKATRLVQLLDPHFNLAKERQIEGRAIRFGSHSKLPVENRNVLVQRYLAEPQAGWLDRLRGKKTIGGSDEYIRQIALRKEQLNSQLMHLLEGQELPQ